MAETTDADDDSPEDGGADEDDDDDDGGILFVLALVDLVAVDEIGCDDVGVVFPNEGDARNVCCIDPISIRLSLVNSTKIAFVFRYYLDTSQQ